MPIEEEIEKSQKQVRILVDLIFAKGLAHSLKVAMRLDDPFTLSELYRSLTKDFFEELVKRKKLKKI